VSLRFLLDTNIIIGLDKGLPAVLALLSSKTAHPDVCAVSQLTRLELLSFHGLTTAEEARIFTLLAAVQVLMFDELVEREAITLRRRLRLKLPDAIVGATAKVHGLELVTLDERLTLAIAST
jgi:predicted nucleic acid-binding protein